MKVLSSSDGSTSIELLEIHYCVLLVIMSQIIVAETAIDCAVNVFTLFKIGGVGSEYCKGCLVGSDDFRCNLATACNAKNVALGVEHQRIVGTRVKDLIDVVKALLAASSEATLSVSI